MGSLLICGIRSDKPVYLLIRAQEEAMAAILSTGKRAYDTVICVFTISHVWESRVPWLRVPLRKL